MRRLFMLSVILMLFVLVLSACGGDEKPPAPTATPVLAPAETATPAPTPMEVPEANTDPLTRARLRVVQASPDLPPVNLYLDAGNIGRGFLPGNYHSEPLSLAAGSYLLRVVPAGEDPDTTPLLLSQQIDLEPGQSVIAVLAGSPDALQMIVAREDLAPLVGKVARLNVIHAVPRGAAFNLQEINRTVIGQVDFGMIGGPVELSEGDHPLAFVSGPEILTSLDLTLTARYAYTLVLYQGADGSHKTLHIRSRVSDESRVRLAHASPDLPAVDAYLGDTLVAEALAFGSATDWISFPSLSYNLRVVPAGADPTDSLLQQQIALIPDESMDLVLLNTRDRLRVHSLVEDQSALAQDNARITMIHAAPGSSSIRVIPAGSQDMFLFEIGFGEAAPPFDTVSGPADYVFEDHSSSTPREIDRLTGQNWEAGQVYTVIVTGYPNTDPLVLSTAAGAEDTTAATQGETARYEIRLVNALADGTAVNLSADGAPIFDTVAPGVSTAYRVFQLRPQRIVIHASASDALLADEALPIPDAVRPVRYTLFVYRDQGDARTVIVPDDSFLLGDGQARLRVLHAMPNRPTLVISRQEEAAPQIDEDVPPPDTGGEPAPTEVPPEEIFISGPVEYGRPTDPQVIPAGTYDLRVLELSTGTLTLTISDATIESRMFYDLLLLPDPSGLGITPLLVPLVE